MNNLDQPGEKQREGECVRVCVLAVFVCISCEEWGYMSHLLRHYSSSPHRLQTIYNHPEPSTEAVCAAYVAVVHKMCLYTVLDVALTRPHVPLI